MDGMLKKVREIKTSIVWNNNRRGRVKNRRELSANVSTIH
jgi:hypothetical protein